MRLLTDPHTQFFGWVLHRVIYGFGRWMRVDRWLSLGVKRLSGVGHFRRECCSNTIRLIFCGDVGRYITHILKTCISIYLQIYICFEQIAWFLYVGFFCWGMGGEVYWSWGTSMVENYHIIYRERKHVYATHTFYRTRTRTENRKFTVGRFLMPFKVNNISVIISCWPFFVIHFF